MIDITDEEIDQYIKDFFEGLRDELLEYVNKHLLG